MAGFSPDDLQQIHKQLNQRVEKGSIAREANRIFRSNDKQRQQSGIEDHRNATAVFLRPQDIEKGVQYDIEKVFKTTLGGELRRLNQQDLIAFQKNIELLQDHYVKGITAKQIINLALPIDIERANTQILMAIPVRQKAGMVHFLTNASKDSDVKEHHVNVVFSNYRNLMLSPKPMTEQDVKRHLNYGKLKFECDCGRHTYWYQYMASIGGYGCGRIEEGYPKIRNPELSGVACKHVLRVMRYILSPLGMNYLVKQLRKDRSQQANIKRNESSKALSRGLEQQVQAFEKNTNTQIVKNERKAIQELARRSQRVAQDRQKEIARSHRQNMRRIAKEQGQQAAEKLVKQQQIQDVQKLQQLLRLGLIDQAQFNRFKQGL
ncbi:hypothetical protein [Acinetobacter boissieri]|uniref:SWIM-type domain-containing protein n=1 Tax=Acinetobacter boissieri TaxID=1219383 RepID=A0A1G6KDT8_9GAMM|nr:hypothetical protein [Acinetobacter boissieri]SDC28991.1 hypothetical protein SAMN05421733_11624 [Acinetobacter boissieri]